MPDIRRDVWPPIRMAASKLFDIRKGEGKRATLMLCYIFLIILSLMIVKPVCNSLFLSEFGAEQLPIVFILVAVFAVFGSAIYSRLLRSYPLNRLIARTLVGVIGAFAVFWALLRFDYMKGWALYAFYVLVAIFAVLATAQFWILANMTFNAREAKRLFGYIGSGAIAGGIIGGYVTNLLAPVIGSANLIFLVIGALSICIVLVRKIWAENERNRIHIAARQQEQVKRVSNNPFRLIANSRHLTFLASIVGISVLVAKLVEYQFGAIASEKILSEDQLTAFFGFWLSTLNIISLGIQLFLTRRVVGVFGVGASLFFLPVGILLGASAILINPALWSAIFIKIADGSLKNSVNKAGIELLSLPIPAESKNQTKTFIDVFVDSLATGISGLLLVLFTYVLGFGVQGVSAVTIVMIFLWMYLAYRIRQEYVQSFRIKMESNGNKNNHAPDLRNASVFGSLVEILQGNNEHRILAVLKMVGSVRNPRLLPPMHSLIEHSNPTIRREVLTWIYHQKTTEFTNAAERLIFDWDIDIKAGAFQYLFQCYYHKRSDWLDTHLQHSDGLIRLSAMLCIAREGRNNQAIQKQFALGDLVETEIRNLREISDEAELISSKILCARIIGVGALRSLWPYLHILLNDANSVVKRGTIEAAGHTRDREFVPVFMRYMKDPVLRPAVRSAFMNYGPAILDLLTEVLRDQRESREVLDQIPRIIAGIGTQRSVDILFEELHQTDHPQRYEILKALNRMRLSFPHLRFDERSIANTIHQEARTYTDLLEFYYAQRRKTGTGENTEGEIDKARKQFIEALEVRLDRALERIFRLLGLKYPPDDIYHAYLGIKSNELDLRLNTVEFLDNVMESGLKRILIPLIETSTMGSIADEALEQLGLNREIEEFPHIASVLAGKDRELKIRALYLIAQMKDEAYVPLIGQLINNPDSGVRKMAEFALQSMKYLN